MLYPKRFQLPFPAAASAPLVILTMGAFAFACLAASPAENEDAYPMNRNAIHKTMKSQNQGELLYNGIQLPEIWPPDNIDITDTSPIPIPYLKSPPAVIPIDLGRQLFVDDFLIEKNTLSRTFHKPEKYENNPVLRPETPIELGLVEPDGYSRRWGHGNAGAVPKSGGCWWDPEERVFKMWYETSWFGPIAMATSQDGIHWERPEFDIIPGTNIVSPPGLTPDSWTVTRNWAATDPEEKWMLFLMPAVGAKGTGWSLTSPDGVNWKRRVESGPAGDRSTAFYNPFRKKWVYSLRANDSTGLPGRGRARQYFECDDFMEGAGWQDGAPVAWLMTDNDDPVDYLTREKPQLYNFDAVAYESIMLGWFQIHHGPPNRPYCEEAGLPKITELMYAFSRDGFHFDRPDRRAHIAASRGDFWDRGYIQSLGNVCVIHGDKLLFYFTGYAGNTDKAGDINGYYDNGATGVAMLRRDGFASMDSGDKKGTLTTRPVVFSGTHLFINAKATEGTLRAEVRDLDGNPIAPFTLANSIPFRGDSTLESLQWEGVDDLSALSGQALRFHFELTKGSLYAFWVSQDESGRSDGYLAGGGPGYTGPTDTVGRASRQPD
jgi:hypothetical protein